MRGEKNAAKGDRNLIQSLEKEVPSTEEQDEAGNDHADPGVGSYCQKDGGEKRGLEERPDRRADKKMRETDINYDFRKNDKSRPEKIGHKKLPSACRCY